MANPYYTPSGNPGTSSPGASAPMRSEFIALQAAFDKLPALTANQFVVVNSGGTGLTTIAGLTFTMNAFTVGLVASASVVLTWPATTGTLALVADVTAQATATLLLATPPGVMHLYAGATAPSGYLLCAGQAVSRTGANAALFTAIGTTFGTGDGSTTFNVPDMRGRVPAGLDNPGGLGTAGRNTGSGLTATTLGSAAGVPTNTTTMSSTGVNAINFGAGWAGFTSGGWSGSAPAAAGGDFNALTTSSISGITITQPINGNFTINVAGTSASFNTTQPTIIMNYIIKL